MSSISSSEDEEEDSDIEVYFEIRDLFRTGLNDNEIEQFDALEQALAGQLQQLGEDDRQIILDQVRRQYDVPILDADEENALLPDNLLNEMQGDQNQANDVDLNAEPEANDPVQHMNDGQQGDVPIDVPVDIPQDGDAEINVNADIQHEEDQNLGEVEPAQPEENGFAMAINFPDEEQADDDDEQDADYDPAAEIAQQGFLVEEGAEADAESDDEGVEEDDDDDDDEMFEAEQDPIRHELERMVDIVVLEDRLGDQIDRELGIQIDREEYISDQEPPIENEEYMQEQEEYQEMDLAFGLPQVLDVIQNRVMEEHMDQQDAEYNYIQAQQDQPLVQIRAHVSFGDEEQHQQGQENPVVIEAAQNDGPAIGPFIQLSQESTCHDEDSSLSSSSDEKYLALFSAEEYMQEETSTQPLVLVDWSLLPLNITTDIMRYLPDIDKISMAKTCKCWHRILSSAVLWRMRIIRFHGSGLKAKAEAKRIKGFAERHGHWIQRLSIYCDHPSYAVCRTFQKSMTDFLGTLIWQKAILKRFCMRRLYVERYWRYDTIRDRLVGSLSRFFKKQTQLRHLDLSDGHWGLTNGLKILDAVSQGCKGTRKLDTLNLEDFFSSRLSLFRLGRYQNILSKFKGLTTIFTNYNCISEEIVETLARNCEGKLQLLSLKVYRTEPHTHVIPAIVWRQTVRRCPRLKVDIYIEGMGNFNDISVLLAKDMPIRVMQIWTGIHPIDQQWSTDRLFRHIAINYANTLEEAYLSVEPEGEDIDDAVIYLLENCKLLDSLDLQTTLLVETVDNIYKSADQNKIRCHRLHANLNNLTGVDIEVLDIINSRWEGMVEEKSFNWEFEANELVLF